MSVTRTKARRGRLRMNPARPGSSIPESVSGMAYGLRSSIPSLSPDRAYGVQERASPILQHWVSHTECVAAYPISVPGTARRVHGGAAT
eukprot:3281030-Rhodomonas_salina.2